MSEHIVIISGADPLPADVVAHVPEPAIVLAADGGLDLALAAGLRPFGLIGDLDSVSAEGLAWAEEHATISRHPGDKDTTDTELALAFAADMNPERITLIGGGDRLDHGISAIGALGARKLTHVPMLEAWWDGQHVDVLQSPERCVLHLVPGSTLSLLALHGPVRSVSIDGVRWPLDEFDLAPLIGHGVSNEVLADRDDERAAGEVGIELSSGVLTVFDVPSYLGSDPDGSAESPDFPDSPDSPNQETP